MSSAVAKPRVSTAGPRRHPLLLVLAAVCAGVVLDRYMSAAAGLWWVVACCCWGAWLVLWRRRFERVAGVLLLVSAAAVGAAWHHCCWDLFPADEIARFAGSGSGPAAVAARVVGGPRFVPAPPFDPLCTVPLGDRTRVEVEVCELRDGRDWRHASGRAMLLVSGEATDLNVGDTLRIFCQLNTAHPPGNPGEFDFAAVARAERRLCTLRADVPECLTRLTPGRRWGGAALVERLRAGGRELLQRYVSPRYAGLAAAMFLGIREDLQPEDSQAFLETGTVHLLVVSGLNVAVLAGGLWLLLRLGLMPRSVALGTIVFFTLVYALVTDLQPPVVRAAVMVLVVCGAKLCGRRGMDYNALAAAALVVLAMNPSDLFRAGPQLSFLSVGVLAWLANRRAAAAPADPLDTLIANTRPWHERIARRLAGLAWEAVVTSAVIWLVVSPLVLARFHLLSPAAVVLGPLLAFPVWVAMAAGFGVMATGAWLSPAAAVCGAACTHALQFIEQSVSFGQRWSAGHFWLPGPADWWLAGLYLGLALWIFAPHARLARRWGVALLCGWIALGFGVGRWEQSRRADLTCTVLSVGHGTAVVLELPGGRTLLYDAGHLGPPNVASRAVAAYLWSRGRTHLDAVVLSHADADHYNGLPALCRQFSIGAVYVSPVMFENTNGGLQALREAIGTAGIPVREIWSGDTLKTGDQARIEVLHPPRHGVLGTDNANSIVLNVEYAGRRILLTGDLESPGLDDVLAEEPLDCDVLLAPHHGSAYSAAPRVAAWCRPEWTIVSGSERDQAPIVQRAYGAHGKVLHTALLGAIQFHLAAERIHVGTLRDPR